MFLDLKSLISYLSHFGYTNADVLNFFRIPTKTESNNFIFIKHSPDGGIEIQDTFSLVISKINKEDALPLHILLSPIKYYKVL